MKLGAFSISLSVKDIETSKSFYENLGFEVFAGDVKMKYLIMKNGSTLIGLFQGMLENNLLTFNPGWDQNASNLEDFDDLRIIQRKLQDQNIEILNEVEPDSSGPGSFSIVDPDGNMILIDQHV